MHPNSLLVKKYICFCLLNWGLLTAFGQTTLLDLRVEYQTTPLGLDVAQPRFSCNLGAAAASRGVSQQTYRIQVRDSADRLLWDSERVDSGTSVNIPYQGPALRPESRYDWTVSIWDQDGQRSEASSWFETGLLDPDPASTAWAGAEWIGGGDDDLVLYAQALSVFKLGYRLRLDEASASTRAALVLGANDHRLMDGDLNILGVENGPDESYLAFELDISKIGQEGGLAQFHIYRVGYTPQDRADRPLVSFAIPERLIDANNKYDWHEIFLEMNFGIVQIYLDGRDPDNIVNRPEEELPPWVDVRGTSLNPHGDAGGDLIVYPLLADIGFRTDRGQRAAFAELRVMNFRAPANSLFSEELPAGAPYAGIFQHPDLTVADGAYHVGSESRTVLITADPSRNAMPMLRSAFTLDRPVVRARLYVTARGIYEMYLNGERVGEDYFNPGLTQYNKTHLYQTYDVTGLLQAGENAIGALLGEGWWSGNITYRGYNWNYFGDRQSLRCKLAVTYADGSTDTIVSDPAGWTYFDDGPIRYSSFFQGEIYDAGKEDRVAGWSTAAYDDSAWEPAEVVPLDSTTAYLDASFDHDDARLIGQIDNPARIVATLEAQSVEEVRPGVFVYDMGQNMVGFPRIELSGAAGDTITLRYAEMRYPDLPEHAGQVAMIMMENIRGALTIDRWILRGGAEVIQPHFTFHGYRYLEITGIDAPLPLDRVQGKVVSSILELASSYTTSNDLVNRLWKNITWSFRGNFLSIPTDTPARNERMGWNGDINVFAKTATFLGDVALFLDRHLLANRELQAESGRFPDIAPIGTGFGGTLWGSAGVTIPWELYQQYDDRRVLADHYPAMRKYVDFLASRQDPETGILDEGPLGDWLSPEGYKNDNSLLWTAYQVRCLEILANTAELLGKTEDAATYRQQYAARKAFFNATYVDPATGKTIHSGYAGRSLAARPEGFTSGKGDTVDTQASYAIPLAFGVFDERNRERAARYLAQAVNRKNRDFLGVDRPEKSLMTGFIGTAALSPALSQTGRSDLAYDLLQQRQYPSWLYSVVNGATTIWERLNSYTIENGFGGNNSMNSFNHYSFGAVGAWMYNYSLGIQRGEPGFKSFVLHPTPDPTGQMNWAEGHYDSSYGRIVSEWRVEEGVTRYHFVVPANTTATLYLPAAPGATIRESGRPVARSEGITELGREGNRVRYWLQSGTYRFTVQE